MTSVKEKAYAKINLYLDVTAKRDDGFHDICTVMHTLSLCDDVTVTINGRGARSVTMQIGGCRRIPFDSRNIAYSAAMLFMETLGIYAQIHIKLEKRIPVSAGLAGGSSDAAAVLRAMNKIFSRPFTEKRLLELAAQLGSDVPYCLLGGTALCEGRGEQITRLDFGGKLYAVIASTPEHVSTPEAYKALDVAYSDFDGSVPKEATVSLDRMLAAIESGTLSDVKLFNVFEKTVLPSCPKASELHTLLPTLGAYSVLMSGSGPSVFALFLNEEGAVSAADMLRERGIDAYYAESV